MTATIEETDLSTFEDIAPPCDFDEHDQFGDGPAVWAWTLRNPGTCGCHRRMTLVLVCEGCWAELNTGPIHCSYCKRTTTVSAETISVVRL